MNEQHEIKKYFDVGDMIIGVGKHKGMSEIFEQKLADGSTTWQPFSYLNCWDHTQFRRATQEEIQKELERKIMNMY